MKLNNWNEIRRGVWKEAKEICEKVMDENCIQLTKFSKHRPQNHINIKNA